MKFVACFLMLMLVGYSYQFMMEEYEKVKRDCIEDVNVSQDLVTKFENMVVSDDKTLHCYVKCVFIQMGVMSDSGEALIDAAKVKVGEAAEKEELLKAIDECGKINGPDTCETAYGIYKCMLPHIKE